LSYERSQKTLDDKVIEGLLERQGSRGRRAGVVGENTSAMVSRQSTRVLMDTASQGAKDPATATPHVPPLALRASGTPRPSNMSSPSKKEINEMYKAIVTEDFDAKAKEAKSKAGTEEGSDLLSFDQALLFDEGMLNSWFQEDALPIRDRAILLKRVRQYKESFAHQSTETIESELTTKMLFDALLFAVAFTVPTGVDRAEMQEAWMADDEKYNVSKKHLGNYEVILLVMTYLVTTSTGMALIIGFTIYGCLHSARPSSIEEADAFYARFKVAFRLSYGFTYAAVLLTPFSCLELHFIKSSSEPTRVFFAMYGVKASSVLYTVLLFYALIVLVFHQISMML
jgi:hypothetical protein